MNNLPIELSEKIFQLLHQKDKVECLMVCRAWKYILENTVLLSVVRLHSTNQLNKLIDKLGRERHQRQKVKRLIIEMKHIESTEFDVFPLLFSSVQEVTIYQDMSSFHSRFTKQISSHPWSTTIKSIKEENSTTLTYYILKGCACPLLTEITIAGKHQQIGDELLGLLGNAPALRFLTLKRYSLTLMDLETLHRQVPLLTSLSLDYIAISSEDIPTEVESASFMVKLSVQTANTFSTETYIVLLNYFTNKYTKITDLVYLVKVRLDANFSQCMNMGLLPHIQKITPYLESLTLSDPQFFRYVFPVLSQSNCHLKEFKCCEIVNKTQFTQIVQSSQAQSIQVLSLIYMLDNILANDLSRFTALTELILSYTKEANHRHRKRIYINHLLDDIGGTLTTLKLIYASLIINNEPIVQSCPNLKNLALKECNTPDRIGPFISQSFPNLRALTIDHCEYKTSIFYLGDLDLSYIEFRDLFQPSDEHVLIVTLCDNQKRWYITNNASKWNRHPHGSPTDYPSIKSLSYNKFGGLPRVSFICNSLFSFIMVNTFP